MQLLNAELIFFSVSSNLDYPHTIFSHKILYFSQDNFVAHSLVHLFCTLYLGLANQEDS